jgi:hypothetical protein
MNKYNVIITEADDKIVSHDFWNSTDEEAIKLCKQHKGNSKKITLSIYNSKNSDRIHVAEI